MKQDFLKLIAPVCEGEYMQIPITQSIQQYMCVRVHVQYFN